MKSKKVLLSGFPASGKTTFIAALWYYVSAYKNNGALTLNSLAEGDEEYLNRIRNYWITYQKVPRTAHGQPKGERVIMNLKKVGSQDYALMDIPDFSGEMFQSHFELREWSEEYNQVINEIDGLILFINPFDENNRPHLITTANEIASMFGGSIDINEAKGSEWEIRNTPTQVKLVESLQFVSFQKEQEFPIKIAIVISAWDQVKKNHGQDKSPEKWLGEHLPLLHQYIRCNSELFTSRYFGVSAQGGDYDDEVTMDELVNKDPLKRILVVEQNNISNDIGLPIQWVTE